ncbi:adhesion G-protein coupled receptor F1-like [Fundulus diaphanus]
MMNILETVGTLTIEKAKSSWKTLNEKDTEAPNQNIKLKRASSSLLYSLEIFTSHLVNKSFNISTHHIHLNKTTIAKTFRQDFNSSVEIDIAETGEGNQSITVVIFASMDNVLPAKYKDNSSNVINGKVALLRPKSEITNMSLTFDILHSGLENPKCVFWDFNLFEGLGGWNDDGCILVFNENGMIRCNCNHTTTFSILMSPNSPNDPALTYLTCMGVGISMGSLIICLIIEGIVWKTIGDNVTSYLRHVSIVNIAVSLLIANIWFIIGASISKTKSTPACTAATFFIHFFYLALFFWMLASALLLLYWTVSVFDRGLSKMSMLVIGFSLGYGAPLIIASLTIATTASSNRYISKGVCWLNWDGSKALLAFVIPALIIVVINLIILIVVLYKILTRSAGGNAAQAREKHVLVVIARSLAVLMPNFGLTWGLGIGTMVAPKNTGIHLAFAFFNSLQGFFILIFGPLLDKKALSMITLKFSRQNKTNTNSVKSFFGLANLIQKLKRGAGSLRGYVRSSNELSD